MVAMNSIPQQLVAKEGAKLNFSREADHFFKIGGHETFAHIPLRDPLEFNCIVVLYPDVTYL